jgi:hypothetical protein
MFGRFIVINYNGDKFTVGEQNYKKEAKSLSRSAKLSHGGTN